VSRSIDLDIVRVAPKLWFGAHPDKLNARQLVMIGFDLWLGVAEELPHVYSLRDEGMDAEIWATANLAAQIDQHS
jgi:hypothetical protein